MASVGRVACHGHLQVPKIAAGHHLGFLETEIITNGSGVPENPTLEPNITFLSCTEPELWHFKYLNNTAAVRHLGFRSAVSRTTHDGILVVLSVLLNFVFI